MPKNATVRRPHAVVGGWRAAALAAPGFSSSPPHTPPAPAPSNRPDRQAQGRGFENGVEQGRVGDGQLQPKVSCSGKRQRLLLRRPRRHSGSLSERMASTSAICRDEHGEHHGLPVRVAGVRPGLTQAQPPMSSPHPGCAATSRSQTGSRARGRALHDPARPVRRQRQARQAISDQVAQDLDGRNGQKQQRREIVQVRRVASWCSAQTCGCCRRYGGPLTAATMVAIIVQQHRLASRHSVPPGLGYADVGALEGWALHAIARHGDKWPGLQGLNDADFCAGSAGVNLHLLHLQRGRSCASSVRVTGVGLRRYPAGGQWRARWRGGAVIITGVMPR